MRNIQIEALDILIVVGLLTVLCEAIAVVVLLLRIGLL